MDKQSKADVNHSPAEESKVLKAELYIAGDNWSYNIAFLSTITAGRLEAEIFDKLHLSQRGGFRGHKIWRLILRTDTSTMHLGYDF